MPIRFAVVLGAAILASGCSWGDGEAGEPISPAEATELRSMCEERKGGVTNSSLIRPDQVVAACELMVGTMGVFGTNCGDFEALRASWELYLNEGGESYGDCQDRP